MIEGIDYAFTAPSVPAIHAAGKKFVVRYGGPGSIGKQLSNPEFVALRDAGIAIVANAEGTSGGFRGVVAGKSWAKSALAHFNAFGMPDDRPIYFSVDWNAKPSDWPDIDHAIQGAASVIGLNRVGIYGSYATIEHCHSIGIEWLWQTYAWSSGKLHTAVNLFQYDNGVTIGSGDCDLNRAYTTDYGQWGVPMEISQASLDKIAALIQAPYQDTDKTGLSETQVGHAVGVQEWPDYTETDGPKVPQYVAFGNMTKVLMAVSDKLDEVITLLAAK